MWYKGAGSKTLRIYIYIYISFLTAVVGATHTAEVMCALDIAMTVIDYPNSALTPREKTSDVSSDVFLQGLSLDFDQ